jgi:hypothetical protein
MVDEMIVEKCWFCGRTEKQVVDEDFSGIVHEALEEKHPVLVHFDSMKWASLPPICCVCQHLLFEHLINSHVVFDDDLRGISLV